MKVNPGIVLTIIARCVNLVEIKDESRIVEDLGADSLDCFEIMMTLEDTFDIVITDEEAEKVRTVGEAVALVIEKAKTA